MKVTKSVLWLAGAILISRAIWEFVSCNDLQAQAHPSILIHIEPPAYYAAKYALSCLHFFEGLWDMVVGCLIGIALFCLRNQK